MTKRQQENSENRCTPRKPPERRSRNHGKDNPRLCEGSHELRFDEVSQRPWFQSTRTASQTRRQDLERGELSTVRDSERFSSVLRSDATKDIQTAIESSAGVRAAGL